MSVMPLGNAYNIVNKYATNMTGYSQDIRIILNNIPLNIPILENTPIFNNFMNVLISHTQYSYLLGIEKFLRGIHLLEQGDIQWGHVSLYYAAYFLSKTIMGLFCVGGELNINRKFIKFDVISSIPNASELIFNRDNRHTSHKAHWTNYFQHSTQIQNYIPPNYTNCFQPPHQSIDWMTIERNEINYSSVLGIKNKLDFIKLQKSNRIINNIPSNTKEQYNLTKDFLETAKFLIDSFSLSPSSLNFIYPRKVFNEIIIEDVYNYKRIVYNNERLRHLF